MRSHFSRNRRSGPAGQSTRRPAKGQGKTRQSLALGLALALTCPQLALADENLFSSQRTRHYRMAVPNPVLSLVPLENTVIASLGLDGVAWYDRGATKHGAGYTSKSDWPTVFATAAPDYGPDVAFLAGRFGTIRLVDFANENADSPRQILQWQVEGIPTGLAYRPASETLPAMMVVAGGAAGVAIWQWEEGTELPVLRGRFPYTDYSKRAAFVTPTIAAIADNSDTGLLMLGVADPMRPLMLETRRTGSFCDSVAVSPEDNSIFAVDRVLGLQVFQWQGTDHEGSLEQAAHFSPPSEEIFARHVTATDQGVLLAENEAGIRWFTHNPTSQHWEEKARFPTSSGPAAEAIFETPTRIAVTTFYGGLEWIELSPLRED